MRGAQLSLGPAACPLSLLPTSLLAGPSGAQPFQLSSKPPATVPGAAFHTQVVPNANLHRMRNAALRICATERASSIMKENF